MSIIRLMALIGFGSVFAGVVILLVGPSSTQDLQTDVIPGGILRVESADGEPLQGIQASPSDGLTAPDADQLVSPSSLDALQPNSGQSQFTPEVN